MSRFGGLPGMGSMEKLMKQAQKMQEDTLKLQETMDKARIDAVAGGGMVTVTVNGNGNLVGVKINPLVCDPEDVEMLEDLILTAAKEAAEKAKADQQEKVDAITGGLSSMGLPPGLI